jgi:hypothetical protein
MVTSHYQPGLLAIVELCLDDTLFDRIKLNGNRNSVLSGIPNKDLESPKPVMVQYGCKTPCCKLGQGKKNTGFLNLRLTIMSIHASK